MAFDEFVGLYRKTRKFGGIIHQTRFETCSSHRWHQSLLTALDGTMGAN